MGAKLASPKPVVATGAEGGVLVVSPALAREPVLGEAKVAIAPGRGPAIDARADEQRRIAMREDLEAGHMSKVWGRAPGGEVADVYG